MLAFTVQMLDFVMRFVRIRETKNVNRNTQNLTNKLAEDVVKSAKENTEKVRNWRFQPEIESLAAPGAIAGTVAVRCDVAAPVTTGAKLLRNGHENVTLTGRLCHKTPMHFLIGGGGRGEVSEGEHREGA